MTSKEEHHWIPPLVPDLCVDNPDRVKREREKLTVHRSSVVRLSPFSISSMPSNALHNAVKQPHGSCMRCPPMCQGCVAVQRVSNCPDTSLVHVDRSAPLHTAMPVQCLPLGCTTVYLMPSPLSLFSGGVSETCCQHVMSFPAL